MPLYRKKPVVIEAVRWNAPAGGAPPLRARDCTDHPAVRPTSYAEVAELLGTSGCSREEPYWAWMVMGVIDTLEGRHVVIPGDWVVTGVRGEVYPVKDAIFRETYEPAEEGVA